MAFRGILLGEKNRWGVINAVALAVLLAVVFFVSNTKVTASEFTANLREVKENSLIAEGKFLDSEGKDPGDKARVYKVEVLVGPATKIKRVGLLIPRTDKMFIADQLPKVEKDVDLETLRKDFNDGFQISLDAKAAANVYESLKFEASEITYRVPIYPQ